MKIQLIPLSHEIRNAYWLRRCKIIRMDENGSVRESELWFQLDKSIPLPNSDDCDSYLIAMLMDAMKEKRSIEVKGSVSRQLLSNLVEFQAAWCKWLPQVYSQIEITADFVRDESKRESGAVCAFSGGVDATFSVWRHTQKKWSHRSQEIKFCCLVHGFDIPLHQEAAFKNALYRSQTALQDVGIELIAVKSNFRSISNVEWMHSFSCALVASLANYKKAAGTILIGSNEPYNSLVMAVGSSPITDHLLSSDDVVVIHDGASHSRTEKVREICEWDAGMKNLRVCWQGELKDRNCGVCEKCLRTKLNFLAVKAPIPASFPESNIISDLKRIVLTNDAVRAEWQQIYEIARKNRIREPWVTQIPAIIRKKPMHEKLLPHGSKQRVFILEKVLPEGSKLRDTVKKLTKK